MPTSLVSTGVQFPDSTIQTTAASAGGTITATASGSISAGAPVIMNSDGTVSSVAATAGSYTTGSAATKTVNASYSVQFATISFDTVRNTAVVFYIDTQFNYLYALPGVISGTSISWGTPVLITSYPTVGTNSYSAPTSVYVANVGLHACFWTISSINQLYMSCVSVTANGGISVVTAAQGVNVGQTYAYYPSVTYDAATSRIVLICTDPTTFQQVGGFCGYLSSSGALTSSPFVIEYSYTNAAPTAITTTSTGKVIFFWLNSTGWVAQIAQLPSSGNTLTNVSSTYTVATSGYNTRPMAVGIDSATGNALFAYVPSSGTPAIKAASISGYTLSFGSASTISALTATDKYLALYSMPGSNVTHLFTDTYNATPLYAVPITVSGLTITAGTAQNAASTTFGYPKTTPDPIGLQFISAGVNGGDIRGNTFTNVTTNLTSTNFLGLSSASYTNGQTATINIVSSTNSSQSGLTAGLKYYVLGSGALNSSATSNPYAGLARSSTSILVKG